MGKLELEDIGWRPDKYLEGVINCLIMQAFTISVTSSEISEIEF